MAIWSGESLAYDVPGDGGGNAIGSATSTETGKNPDGTNLSKDPKSSVSEPVDLATGQFYSEVTDFTIPGRLPLTVKRFYRSGSTYQGMFGRGWNLLYNERLLLLSTGNLLVRHSNTQIDEFTSNGDNTFSGPAGVYDTITRNGDGTYTLRDKHGNVRRFNTEGCLTEIRDRNGNQVLFTYVDGGKLPINAISEFSHYTNAILVARDYRLMRMETAFNGARSGRYVQFAYDSNGRATTATDFAGRSWTYTYDSNGRGNLLSVTTPPVPDYPGGLTTAYTYSSNAFRLASITDPSGQTYLNNIYDPTGRVARQVWGPATNFFSYPSDTVRTETNGNGYVITRTFDTNGNVLVRTEYTKGLRLSDPASYVTRYTYNANNEQSKVVYAGSNVETRAYDASGNLTELRRKPADQGSSAADIATAYTYDPRFNFVKTSTDPRGFTALYTYDYEVTGSTNGNLMEIARPLSVATAQKTWPNKMRIRFAGYTQNETLTNFPVLVVLNQAVNGFDYGQCSANGADIRFADSTGTQLLNHEIEEWNTNGNSYVWVQVPALVTSNDCAWLYWGRAGETTPPDSAEDGSTWSQGYAGVWHLGPRLTDSTGRGADGYTNGIAGAVDAAGAIGRARDFSSTAVGLPDNSVFMSLADFTVSAWVKPRTTTGWDTIFAAGNDDIDFCLHSGRVDVYANGDHEGLQTVQAGSWSLVHFVRTGGVWRTYINGVFDNSGVGFAGPNTPGSARSIGRDLPNSGTELFDGLIDELRWSSVGRSSRWIWACWMNQASNQTFVAYEAASSGSYPLPEYGYTVQGWATNSFTYNAYGQVETATDPNGTVTKYQYDSATGYLLSRISAFGTFLAATNSFTYDARGNVLTSTDPRGNTTTFQYDNLDRLTQVTAPAPLSYVTKYTYNANGKVSKIERQTGDGGHSWQTTTYTYDILDRLKTVTDDMGHVTTYAYDANGNRTSVTDANGNATTYAYDERDLLWKVTDALTNTTAYSYDSNGNLARLTDARSNSTFYAYDGFDRLVTNTYADASFEAYTYDKAGNLTAKRTRAGQVISNAFDALNRLDLKTYPDGSTVDYVYDAGSRLTRVTDTNGVLTFAYDALSRLTVTTNTFGMTVAYEYDRVGNRAKLIYPDATFITYGYDALNRLTNIWQGGTSTVARFAYDALSRRTQLNLGNGTRAAYGYDWANNLTNLLHYVPATGSNLAQFAYTVDNVGNRLTMKTAFVPYSGTHAYGYDKTYQLTSAAYPAGYPFPDETFNYDALGNRTTVVTTNTTTYVANNLNQYTSVGGVPFAYDLNGNLTNDGVLALGYDPENRLITATRPGTNAVYKYDAFGRRIEKNVSGVILRFTYAGDQIVAEYDGGGTLQRKYIYGTGIDEPLRMDAGANRYYYHVDGLGSVVALTGAFGDSVVHAYFYSAFGREVRALGLTGNRFTYTGREYDGETDVYENRFRNYHPLLGRFLEVEPLGHSLGMNLYAYVGQNPVNLADPFGLFKLKTRTTLRRLYGPTMIRYDVNMSGSDWNLMGKANLRFRVDPEEVSADFEFEGTIGGRPVQIQGQLKTTPAGNTPVSQGEPGGRRKEGKGDGGDGDGNGGNQGKGDTLGGTCWPPGAATLPLTGKGCLY